MRVLIEPSAHHLLNAGDASMLRVAFDRVRELWPEASVGIITEHPGRLATECPGAVAVPVSGRQLWLEQPYFGHRVHRALPPSASDRLRSAERELRCSYPALATAAIRTRRKVTGSRSDGLREFLDWALHSDVLIVSGAGLITDAFAPRAISVLELVESAIRRGATTALMSQGVSRFNDPELVAVARTVLPRVDLIALREARTGVPVLRGLGVRDHKLFVTGDDAVELAFRNRPTSPTGDSLGVAVRVARYSGVTPDHLYRVGRTLHRAANARGADLAPIPISRAGNEQDSAALVRVIGGTELHPAESPIEQVRRCRLVVAGSYHAAVFALAQGIPAIGLAAAQYYVEKFLGLADQFDGHFTIVHLDESGFEEHLEKAIDDSWEHAQDLRGPLLQAADRQVRADRVAYSALHEIARTNARFPRRERRPAVDLAARARSWAGALFDPRRRFNCQDQDDPNWDERAIEAARLLAHDLDSHGPTPLPIDVGDLGCGNERLRDALHHELGRPFRYRGYDLHPQSSTVEYLDAQRDLPAREFDALFCLGLLEYIDDLESLAMRVRDICDRLIVSYVISDSSERLTESERAARGWRHHYTQNEFEAIFSRCGLAIENSVRVEAGRTVVWLWRTQRTP